ncbi:protein mono-ADP-ribosyltransferase PARP4 isoform X4 [Hyla sarda]|uniref:protein mono-ADP-ribosyltransferase PARP4 isoform X4 n=1 Tax=Hyla sarda TaxID=327740 RepID=UPI0024C41097|nr:protein mono-ADP-ribosyltransferase PARP4 isoform X4 [Hyla sarda]
MRMGVGIFSDCIFFLKVNSLPLKEKKKLKNTITLNGGEISFVLSEKCTHAVVSNPATLNSTQQKKIEKHTISVVNPGFIWKSVQEEQLIEVECEDNDKPSITVEEDQDKKKNQFLAKFVKKKETLESNLDDVEFEDNEEDDNTSDTSEVAKYCCFQKDEEYAIVELLCFTGQCPLPFRVSTVYGLSNTSQKEFTFNLVETAEKACEKYDHRINEVKNKGFTQVNKIPLQAENLASKALQKVLLGEAVNVTELTSEVAGLVESIWIDAIGHLDSILSCPVESISLNDLCKAEGILCQIRNALTNKDKEGDIFEMMQEFYRFIPHKEKIQKNINMKFLTAKQDLCQVVRDMINVCETSLSSYVSTSTAKYQALRCRIEHIDPNSAEFLQVKQGLLDHNHSNREFNILRVFRVGRLSEVTNFKSDFGNVNSLLHASSPCNFVGILSRGLMLPKIIVEEFGGDRTDVGNLGSGIYFSDSISTSIKYSQPSSVTGSRLLVVCEVALGKCTDVFHRDYTITEPPNGFHSVHGVRRKDGVNSDFSDDEYVVYDVNQVQMKYIVQFSTDGDNVDLQAESMFISFDETLDHCNSQPEPSEDVSLDLPEPCVTKAGLKGSDGQQIPLQSIHIKARLMDLAAKVVIFQTYKNNSPFPIEAKYVFPLDSTAAVCGFEAFINGKHIIGEVKEKQQAHREYRTAINEGHGAYLMDQDAPDVFTVSVGNLPPKATVIIKITYVMELQCQYNCIEFTIPGNVAQWQQDNALKENTQDTVSKVGIESDMAPKGSFILDMSIELPRKLETLYSCTHEIKIKRTKCKAVVQTEESSSFNDIGFSLRIFVESAYIPRMWVEKHPDKDSEACMLIFQPEFDSCYEEIYMTICLDCSNSMESCFQSAKQVALLALRSILGKYMNVVLFGSNYKEFYHCPKQYQCDDYNVDMERFIKEAKPTMGSTEFWKVLQSLCLLRTKVGRHKVLLISDGHLQNENLVFQILNKNKNHVQLFTCGVGTTANKHMLRCFAQYGSGAFEYFADSSKSTWKEQLDKHRSRLDSSACTSVSVKWRQYNQNTPEILQAPANIQALFQNDNLLVYGFVPHCTQATLKAFFNDKEFENMVSTTELQKTTGTILHTLTARALIRDYEEGILHEKENENEMKKQEMKSCVIELSKEYSLVTQFTSFVAVEKRSAEEDMDVEPNVLEIISAEDVDILPYMDWSYLDDERSTCQSSEESSRGSSPVKASEENEEDMFLIAETEGVYDYTPYEAMAYQILEEIEISVQSCPVLSEHFPKQSNSASPPEMSAAVPRKLARRSLKGLRSPLKDSAELLSQSCEPQALLSAPIRAKSILQGDRASPPERHGAALERLQMFGFEPLSSSTSEDSADLPLSWRPAAAPAVPVMAQDLSLPCPVPPPGIFGSPASAVSAAPPSFQALSQYLRPSPPEIPKAAPEKRSTVKASADLLHHTGVSPAWMPAPVMAQDLSVRSLPHSLPSPGIFGSLASAVSTAPPSIQDSSQYPSAYVLKAVPKRRMVGYAPMSSSTEEYRADLLPQSWVPAVESEAPAMAQDLSLIHRFPGPPPPPPPVCGVSPSIMGNVVQNICNWPSSSYPGGVSPVLQRQVRDVRSLHGGPGQMEKERKLERLRSENTLPQLPLESSGDLLYLYNISSLQTALFGSALVPRAGIPSGAGGFSTKNIKALSHLSPEGSRCSGSIGSNAKLKALTALLHLRERCAPVDLLSSRHERKRLVPPSWSSLSSLQSPEGYWQLNIELGALLKINVLYLTEDFLVKKGIRSLGTRGVDTIHKLMATLLVLQIIRVHNILSGITFKSLMKLEPPVLKSLPYSSIEKAIEWAGKSDRQYSGICVRLGLGKDWEQATRQLLRLDPISTTSDIFSVSDCLFLL